LKYRKSIPVTLLIVSLAVIAAETKPEFPKLTGRVVDNASMLDTSRERRISELLRAHEDATTNQVVVVTLVDLGGYAIETYSYQLGRARGVGQKDKDNGVLLIVAKQERKVRIEVGYGLEGTLTDAIASNIVHTVILPVFRRGDFGEGIELGVNAIIEALGGQYTIRPERRRVAASDDVYGLLPVIFLLFIFGLIVFPSFKSRHLYTGYNRRGFNGGYHGGSSSSWGGFSGGGGSFGGGGASGGW
jgi:uncharacterized protein